MITPEDFFLDADDETVLYLESQALGTLDRFEASYRDLKGVSDRLLNLLIVGIGASFMLLFRSEQWNIVSVGILVFMLGWIGCGFYLLNTCIKTKRRPLATTTPSKLYFPDKTSLDELRRWRVWDMDDACNQLQQITANMANHLDKARRMIALTPCVAIVVTLKFWALTHFLFIY